MAARRFLRPVSFDRVRQRSSLPASADALEMATTCRRREPECAMAAMARRSAVGCAVQLVAQRSGTAEGARVLLWGSTRGLLAVAHHPCEGSRWQDQRPLAELRRHLGCP